MAEPASTSAIAKLYQDPPLPGKSRSIRVLEIEDSDPLQAGNDPLRGKFLIINLSATLAVDFTALSYVWGGEIEDAATTSTISLGVDRISLQLTDNCHNALKALRSSVRSLTIWVDAICINQENDAEKDHQMSLMGDIYSLANKTYIWLGLGDEASTRAMNCLSAVGVLDYFFSTPQQGPGAHIRPRPWSATWALYCRRWKHIKHGLRLPLDQDGLKCEYHKDTSE